MIEEIVNSGVCTSKVDPRGVGDFLLHDRDYLARVAGAVGDVVCRTDQTEHGVVYSVVITVPPETPYDDQPWPSGCEYEVWQRYVRFGATEATQAGGHAFRVAAQDQEAIGAYAYREAAAARALEEESES